MRGTWLWSAALLAAAGCAGAGKLDIRPVGMLAGDGQPVSARVALAQGQLALGNVALAIDEYRRALREEPNSVAALTGMAHCYELMGRFDLTRRYYEQALSLAPESASLSLALAGSLDRQGQQGEALELRREVATRAAGATQPAVTATGSVAELPTAAAAAPAPAPRATLTVSLPAPRPEQRVARLERMSSGEVALVTSAASPWVAHKVAASRRSVTVQFERRAPLVVLNAARVAGIAARTRDYLARRGFAGAQIGDAPARRARTVIQYPADGRARAERIAAQFNFTAQLEAGSGPLTLLVGRDAAPKAPRGG